MLGKWWRRSRLGWLVESALSRPLIIAAIGLAVGIVLALKFAG